MEDDTNPLDVGHSEDFGDVAGAVGTKNQNLRRFGTVDIVVPEQPMLNRVSDRSLRDDVFVGRLPDFHTSVV